MSTVEEAGKLFEKSCPALDAVLTHDEIVVLFHARSVRVYEAVCSLLEQNLPEEALMLSRSLFEDSLRLEQIAQAGDPRAELLLKWQYKSFNEHEGLVSNAAAAGLELDALSMLSAINRERAQFRRYQQRNNIGPARPFLPVKVAAAGYNRMHEFWTYSLAHEAVHGTCRLLHVPWSAPPAVQNAPLG